MSINQNIIFNDQDDYSGNNENNDLSPGNDDIGENSERTPIAEEVNSGEPQENTFGSEGGSGWKNDKPGATNEKKNEKLIPIVTPDNDNGEPGPKSK